MLLTTSSIFLRKNRETKHYLLVNCSIKKIGSCFTILQLSRYFPFNIKGRIWLKIMLSFVLVCWYSEPKFHECKDRSIFTNWLPDSICGGLLHSRECSVNSHGKDECICLTRSPLISGTKERRLHFWSKSPQDPQKVLMSSGRLKDLTSVSQAMIYYNKRSEAENQYFRLLGKWAWSFK